ncbi:hypothetical protein FCOL_06670 [Flavobacterium columnare ATCC 49512]|uniref:Translocation and assembly module TamB C-terminal domain-containing protein n=2 Tax=Flavobacterium columnare TaxID=996 RepID=G8X4V7_FLACA|nr:hypothetical protein FCOL_06670 [Flavobacterium columnare ATCC 49512]
MEEQEDGVKKNKKSLWMTVLKIKMYFFLGIAFLLLLLAIVLSMPSVQTRLGQYATEYLNKEFGTDITVQEANFTVFGGVKLKKVFIKDYKKDTLFHINVLKTNILDLKKLIDGDLHFGEVRMDGLKFKIRNYKGERDTNLDKFIELFDDGKPSTSKKKFLMTINTIHLMNSEFYFWDDNMSNPLVFSAKKLNAETHSFKILGPDVTTQIDEMSFVDNRGIEIEESSSDFTYTKKNIHLAHLKLKTPESNLIGDVELRYDRKDFSDFNNKVLFDVKIQEGILSSNDLNKFYDEFGKNLKYRVKGKLLGTLNNFFTKRLIVLDDFGSQIKGDFQFKNLFSKHENTYYVKGRFSKITSTYQDLIKILPNILGKKIPTNFKKLGTFSLNGQAEIDFNKLKANILLSSVLGTVKTNLTMTHINAIDNATYVGNVKLTEFDLGTFLNRKDLGIVNLDTEVDGRGFVEKYLNTKIKGTVTSLYYNKYNYRNIIVDGQMNKAIFEGSIKANDSNLIMDFDGFLDLTRKESKYNFHAKVEYANLKKLNVYTPDAVSVFRGDVRMDLKGNSIDNIYGNVYINKTSYENPKETYFFDDFMVKSTFEKDGFRTITINSPDIVEGKVEGIFKFKELPNLIENSLGSLYANYSPNKVSKGQFMKFDFNVYSKLIEIFYPEISLGENTFMKGEIDSNEGLFKFNFKSPKIKAYDNEFDNISVDIDNKNPLYNAYVEMDSIKTKYYKVSKMSLINVTSNDTLFVRTEFKGGNKAEDFYNLNLYHTIGKDNKSVVGIKKSEINFKNYLWFLNEKEERNNKIVFNKKLTDFSIEKISLSHNDQTMELMGVLQDSTYKDLRLSFKDVELDKITPAVDNLQFKGKLNGNIDFKQEKSIYEPASELTVDDFSINNLPLGRFDIAVTGDDNLRNFKINSVLNNKGNDILKTEGSLYFQGKKTLMDLDVRLKDFDLSFFTPMGADIITNIRGLASGSAKFEGDIYNPEINGRLYLNQSGIKVPYLNTDYNFGTNSIVEVTENQFSFREVKVTDSKFRTTGTLDGWVKHNKLSDWYLNFNINSDRIVVLDTKDHEGALYYGTAYMDGKATIKGPTNALAINVNATSAEGSSLKIPINDDQASSEKNYIKFVNSKNTSQKVKSKEKDYNGLELNFELNITPVAEIEVIVNKNNGHGLKGRGRGSLLMEINTLGKFNMWGDFQVYDGVYNFKYGGFIDKKIKVKNGGYISWDGDPLNATLNMEAVYKTEANPSILLDNPSFNKKVPTEVVIKLTDKLTNPTPEIFINFPTVSSVLRSEIDYKLNDFDTRQKQALSLISSGSFLSDKGVVENVISGNILERANSLFDDLFANDDRFKLGLNYVQNDRLNQETSTGGRVGFTVSTQISDKITINGKFGVPVGGVNESVVVGDVEIQLRLNEDGSLKARVFNRENDISYLGQGGIGYTQGVGVSYEVDFNTFKELMYKVFNSKKNKTKRKSDQPKEQVPDSDLLPEIIQFTEKRQKKSSEKPKEEEDRIPELN